MSINIISPGQLKQQIARQAKQKRLEKNLSRTTLQEKSGVPGSTIKHFETTGNISLDALLRIALVLDSLNEFSQLFVLGAPVSLYEKKIARQRGRK
jgi:transcriptional regulator with XRE-family HTH domain